MSHVRGRGENVRKYIIENVEKFPNEIARRTAEKFSITRQAANKHIRRLTAEGFLTEEGETKSRVYKLAALASWWKEYEIAERYASPPLAEDIVWRDDVAPKLGKLPDNVRNIWQHAFTEMFNNALDHSEGKTIRVRIEKTAAKTEMWVIDDGVGIFRKIKKALDLVDERHAVLELAKGKFTTDRRNHSGEGIFFTSRMMDDYSIFSGGVVYSHEWGKEHEFILERAKEFRNLPGTSVCMELHNHTARTTTKVYDMFTSKDGEFAFDKTIVPVALAEYGDDQLVSRSQAKRLLGRVDVFRIVFFDFENVKRIGQGFADEIFRVFANQHPEMAIDFMNANSEVKRMIERARAGQMNQDQQLNPAPNTETVDKSVQPELPGFEPTSGGASS
jgi:biotin operon repressor